MIADDEPVSRERMRAMPGEFPHVRLVGECRNGREVLQALEDHEPGGLFLDIPLLP